MPNNILQPIFQKRLKLMLFVLVLGFGFFGLTKFAFAATQFLNGGTCTVTPGQSSCVASFDGNTGNLESGWVGQLWISPAPASPASPCAADGGSLCDYQYPPNTAISSAIAMSPGQTYEVYLITHNSDWSLRGSLGPAFVTASAAPPPTGSFSPTSNTCVASAGSSCSAGLSYSLNNPYGWFVCLFDSFSNSCNQVFGSGSASFSANVGATTNVQFWYYPTGGTVQSGANSVFASATVQGVPPASPPVVSSISPSTYGQGSSGTSIISGSNFTSTVTVNWSGPQNGSGSYSSVNGNSINFAVGTSLTGVTGTYTITVTNSDSLTSSGSVQLTVAPAAAYTPTLGLDCCNVSPNFDPSYYNAFNKYPTQSATHYTIANAKDAAYVLWTSSKDGISYQENCYLGQQTNGAGAAGPISTNLWTPSEIGGWTVRVSFTTIPPALNACGVAEDASLGNATTNFSVWQGASVSFKATMNNGDGDADLSGAYMHYNYTDAQAYGKDVLTSYPTILLPEYWAARVNAQPTTDSDSTHILPGYNNSVWVGFSDQNNNNIAVGFGVANKCAGQACTPTSVNDAFIARYRNTRITVKAVDPVGNPTSLAGTYTITPNSSGNLPSVPTGVSGVTFYGMDSTQTYSFTYNPDAGETLNYVQWEKFGGGWPTENFVGAASTTSNSITATGALGKGDRIVFTVNVAGNAPSVNMKGRPGSGGAPDDGPVYVQSGQSAILSWTVFSPIGPATCELYNRPAGDGSLPWTDIGWQPGSNLADPPGYDTGPVGGGITYRLSCKNNYGTTSDTIDVLIAPSSGVCVINASPSSASYDKSGGGGSIAITSTIGWTATSGAPAWLHLTDSAGNPLSSPSGSGNGTIYYKVDATTASRSSYISIGCATFAVTQTATDYTISESPPTQTISQFFNGSVASGTTATYGMTATYTAGTDNCTNSAQDLYFKITAGLPANASSTDGYINNYMVRFYCQWWKDGGYTSCFTDATGATVCDWNVYDGGTGWEMTGGTTKSTAVGITSPLGAIPAGTYNLTISAYAGSCARLGACSPAGSAMSTFPVQLVVSNKTPYMIVGCSPLPSVPVFSWFQPNPATGRNVDCAFVIGTAGSGLSSSTTVTIKNAMPSTTVNWTATTDQAWCHVSPSSGTTDGPTTTGGSPSLTAGPASTFTLTVDAPTAAMAQSPGGQNYCQITITDQLPADGRYTYDAGTPKILTVDYMVKPADPTGVSAATPNLCPTPEIDITWAGSAGFNYGSSSAGPDSYYVYRNTVNSPPAVPVAALGTTTTSGMVTVKDTTGVSVGTNYYYWVQIQATVVYYDTGDGDYRFTDGMYGAGILVPAASNAPTAGNPTGGISPTVYCDFTLSASPLSLRIAQGGSASYTTNVRGLTNFPDGIRLGSDSSCPMNAGCASPGPVIGAPLCDLSKGPCSATTTAFGIYTDLSTPPGTYTVNVVGTNNGAASSIISGYIPGYRYSFESLATCHPGSASGALPCSVPVYGCGGPTGTDPCVTKTTPVTVIIDSSFGGVAGNAQSVTATNTTCPRVDLSWTGGVGASGSTKYSVWRNSTTTSATAVQIQTDISANGSGGGSYSDTTGTLGTKYYYWVEVYYLNSDGDQVAEPLVPADTNSSGGIAAGACPIPPPSGGAGGNYFTPTVGVIPCGAVKLSWVDQSTNEDGFKIYRNTANNFATATLVPGPPASTIPTTNKAGTGTAYSYQYSPNDEITYYYWIVSYNAVTQSVPLPTSPTSIADIVCGPNLIGSDKDIVAINGNPISPAPVQCGNTDPLPAGTNLFLGDTLTFQINLCNKSGSQLASGIILTDNLVNLTQPTGGWNICYNGTGSSCGGGTVITAGAGSGHYSYDATAKVLTINVSGNAFSIPAGSWKTLTFDATLSVPEGTTGVSSRMQNSFVASYSSKTFSASTPPLLFYIGKGTPSVQEVAP